MIILLSLSFIFWCIGFIVIWKIPYCTGKSLDPQSLPTCSVIIPARNEYRTIKSLLDSLKQQTVPPVEILVCDDHSTDQTAEIAKENGANVLTIPDMPLDWIGKNWALWNGAAVAKGKLFLFLDADTIVDPEGIEHLVITYCQKGGIITVQPFSITQKFYESFSAFFNLLLMTGVTAFTIFGKRIKSSGGFGPCFLCHRDEYFKLDGHRSVKSIVLENLALGRRYQENGGNLNCFGGKGTISFRMYSCGLKDLINGWSKSFASGAIKTNPFWMVLIVFWICGQFQAIRALITTLGNPDLLYGGLTFLLYALYASQIARLFHQIGNFGWAPVVFFPIYLVFFVLVFIWSFIRIYWLKSVTWKGRHVKL